MSLEYSIRKHEGAIYGSAYTAAALGVPGAFTPGLDTLGVAGTWATMMCIIASNANRQLDRPTALKLMSAILSAAAGYLGGSKVFTFALNLIPGLGQLGAIGINSFLNFIYTIRLGKFIAIQMEKNDFDIDDWSNLVPEIIATVFALPSVIEMREAVSDWRTHQQYRQS
jgi:hypothetical protein